MGAGRSKQAPNHAEAEQQGKVLQVVDVFDIRDQAHHLDSFHKFSQFYNNKVSVYRTEWQVEFVKHQLCNDELAMAVADRFSGTKIETALKDIVRTESDGGCIVVFGKVVGKKLVEHILLASKKVNGTRTILVVTGSQANKHSAMGWCITILTGGLLLAGAAFAGPPALAATAIGIIAKLGVDHQMSQVDSTKLAALKYLESRGLIKVDWKKGSIELII